MGAEISELVAGLENDEDDPSEQDGGCNVSLTFRSIANLPTPEDCSCCGSLDLPKENSFPNSRGGSKSDTCPRQTGSFEQKSDSGYDSNESAFGRGTSPFGSFVPMRVDLKRMYAMLDE